MRRVATAAGIAALVLAGALALSSGSGRTARSAGAAALFARSCSGCHTLGASAHPSEGGDLAQARMSIRDLESFTAIMPTRSRLSRTQVRSIAEFVDAAARPRAHAARVRHAPAR